MKYNLFNSIIPLTKKSSLLYNAYTDSFIVFNSKLKECIQNDFPQLQSQYPGLAKKLIDAKCYVENSHDEFESLKKINKKIINDNSSYFVIINPTLSCNFKCWYCYETHHAKSKMSEDIMQRTFALFDNIVNGNKKLKNFAISFFGGEPLLQFKTIVLPIIEYYGELCQRNHLSEGISFTTNGFLISQTMIAELKKHKNVSFQITLDGGEEEHNKVRFTGKKGSYQQIIHNIKMILNNDMYVRLRINYTKDTIHSVRYILNDIKDIPKDIRGNLDIDFHRVWQDRDVKNETDEIREILDLFLEAGFKVIFNEHNEIYNACYADKKNTLIVNYNGDIYKCTAKDFTKENREGFLNESGQVIWKKSQKFRQNVKLSNPLCQTCRIAPLCGSGCSKYNIENIESGNEYCVFNKSHEKMDNLILDRFDAVIRNKKFIVEAES